MSITPLILIGGNGNTEKKSTIERVMHTFGLLCYPPLADF